MASIIYFILLAKGWEFVAIDNEPVSDYYCEMLRREIDSKFEGKMGNMKVLCVPYNWRRDI